MDDVDIGLFRFDWDNTFHMFFLNAQSYIYARYGERKDGDGDKINSLAGIKNALRRVLDVHKKEANKAPPPWKPLETQDLVSFKKDPRRPNGCLHCHHAGYFVRKEEFTTGKLTKDQIWGFPMPENVGITLEIDENNLVREARDPAAKAGVQAGDRVISIDGQRVLTPADFVWALNVFRGGTLKIVVDREGKQHTFTMPLKGDDWRKTDVSWRDSWWGSGPNPGFSGDDLDSAERKKYGLNDASIAVRVTDVKANGSAARVMQPNDIIINFDGKATDMEAIELQMHVRLTRRAGDTVQCVVLRGNQKLPIAIKLK